jgi:GT2 family glycosyltransferase
MSACAAEATELAPLTIVISSYRRRQELERLLRALAGQLAGHPELQSGLDVVVVLDGSTDGSREMVEGLRFPLPVRVLWQRNMGLAAARNAGLAAASGELIWFLDDDLIPGANAVARHRRVEQRGDRRILVGPCHLAPSARVHPAVREFWKQRDAELTASGTVRFDQFSAANTSGPVELFRRVGGFDAGFVGYGGEDYELAVRLLARGITPSYDPEAVVWHHPPHGVVAMCTRMRSEARNHIRLVRAHPETFEVVFPVRPLSGPERLIRRLGLQRRPRVLDGVATTLLPLVVIEARATRFRSSRALGLACAAAYLAGIGQGDPDGRVMARVLRLDERASP